MAIPNQTVEENKPFKRPTSVVLPPHQLKTDEKENNATQIREDGSVELKLSPDTQSLIIVGANGSGKTRMSVWIENNLWATNKGKLTVSRISAQRSLKMPPTANPKPFEKSLVLLNIGSNGWASINLEEYLNQSTNLRYRSDNPAEIYEAIDFDFLIDALFSEDYRVLSLNKKNHTCLKSKLEITVEIFQNLIKNKELDNIDLDLKVKVKNPTSPKDSFPATNMSDGERVIFYLIAKCLLAPDEGCIIVDEPEIHLHRALMIPLWEAIEKKKPGCLFIYLTHDVDFAAAKSNSEKIWVKSYDGTAWEWQKIQPNEQLPEELCLEVLGSRRPILFVEGSEGSKDALLYKALFPELTVKPLGGCQNVIDTVRALRSHRDFHHLAIYGLIDRDYRPQESVDLLKKEHIFATDVAEVENLLCTEKVLTIVSQGLPGFTQENPIAAMKSKVLALFKTNKELQLTRHVANVIKHHFSRLTDNQKTKADLKDYYNEQIKQIDVDSLYQKYQSEIDIIIKNENYAEMLKKYNNKGLLHEAATVLELSNKDAYFNHILALLKEEKWTDQGEKIRQAILPYLGGLADAIQAVKITQESEA